uniref:Histone-lysine N-methyltransferase n=1 Tax=Phlebotomus papatasi TaxID=29031 RepID=A0A1B0DB53_PHLPP
TPRCVPAGCEILSSTRLICPKHWKSSGKHINVNWCFICAEGGNLLCCDNCPSAVHEICAKTSATSESYICDDCESGRTMVYGNIVWAKQAGYRWWPAFIVTENCVPDSLLNTKHSRGDIGVFFLGTHNWAWLPRKRMFLYQEDDAECKAKKSDLQTYALALKEAENLYRVLKDIEAQCTEKIISKIEPPSYKKIIRNLPVAPVTVKDTITDYDDTSFRCTCDEFDKCGSQSSCCNRNLQIECTETNCNLQSCENRRFVNREYPQTEIVLTPNCGFGLVAKEDIREGDFVIEYVGEILNEAEVERRIKYKREERNNVYYFLTLTKDLTIDAEHKGNNARFINHSCDPNCVTQKWSVNGSTRVGIFALQDIPQGTELTFDYHWEKRDSVGTVCRCGALKCSGLIGSERPPRPPIRKKIVKYKSSKAV